MAKNENTLTCIALLVGVLVFLFYTNCSKDKIIEGHTISDVTDAAVAAALGAGADSGSTPALKQCINACSTKHGVPEDKRRALMSEITRYNTLALREETEAAAATANIADQLQRIKKLEARFRNFRNPADANAAEGSPEAEAGICWDTATGQPLDTTTDEGKTTCWSRATSLFESLRSTREVYHGLPEVTEELPASYGGSGPDISPSFNIKDATGAKFRYEGLNPNRERSTNNGGTDLPLGWGDAGGIGWNTTLTTGGPSPGRTDPSQAR